MINTKWFILLVQLFMLEVSWNVEAKCWWCCNKHQCKNKNGGRRDIFIDEIREEQIKKRSRQYLCDFNNYDFNKDGLIAKEELRQMLLVDGPITPNDMTGFELMDKNEDGYVTDEEFDKVIPILIRMEAMKKCD